MRYLVSRDLKSSHLQIICTLTREQRISPMTFREHTVPGRKLAYATLDDIFMTDWGQITGNIHTEQPSCKIGCAIHSPTDPFWFGKQMWGGKSGQEYKMERVCEHGIPHPDRDHVEYMRRIYDKVPISAKHYCDGCCELKGPCDTCGVDYRLHSDKSNGNHIFKLHPSASALAFYNSPDRVALIRQAIPF